MQISAPNKYNRNATYFLWDTISTDSYSSLPVKISCSFISNYDNLIDQHKSSMKPSRGILYTVLAKEIAMSIRRFDDFETAVEEFIESQESLSDVCPSTKLERRRRIEELNEEKMLRQELGDYELDFCEY
ncbi:PA3496 family putative envelope integrity protein [Legionella israelensis]